jgi:hypothetical protein
MKQKKEQHTIWHRIPRAASKLSNREANGQQKRKRKKDTASEKKRTWQQKKKRQMQVSQSKPRTTTGEGRGKEQGKTNDVGKNKGKQTTWEMAGTTPTP